MLSGTRTIRTWLFTSIAALQVACASGVTPRLPALRPLEESAEITVLRNRSLFGSALRVKVFVDGYAVASLYGGEFVTFSVTPGVHAIGPQAGPLALEFRQGERYFLLITPVGSGSGIFEIERISEEDAHKRMRGYRALTGSPD